MISAPSFVPNASPSPTVLRARAIVESATFNRLVVVIILFNAVLIGLGTYSTEVAEQRILSLFEQACLIFYCVELLLRFVARESTRAFFRDAWTIFDLVIIVAAFIPAS